MSDKTRRNPNSLVFVETSEVFWIKGMHRQNDARYRYKKMAHRQRKTVSGQPMPTDDPIQKLLEMRKDE